MTDVLVIGGGLAGWRAAQAAARAGASVTLIANGVGNSPHIHALNCPVLPEDSVELFIEDTMRSGKGVNDRALVETLCRESVALKDEFPFDRDADGRYKTIQPLGSSVPRCVSIGHAIGEYALREIQEELKGRVQVVEGRVTKIDFAETRSVVLATGGWCGKYDFSTNPPYLRGDGIALAQALGAAVRDMDAVQYEPTVRVEGPRRGIPVITTLLYKGATLRNLDGEEFLPDPHLNKDEMSQAILAEMRRIGANGVWYDLSSVPEDALRECRMNVAERRILVAPAPHTSLGGVVIDTHCRVLSRDDSPIPGLFAAGEVTGGLHGRNRLGGNAGTETLVFGKIAGESAAEYARQSNGSNSKGENQ